MKREECSEDGCQEKAEFTIFRRAVRIHACRHHVREIMDAYQEAQHVTTFEEAKRIPAGRQFKAERVR